MRHAATLRLLKETGARIGEVTRLQFKDFDFERKIVRINLPEKHGLPREVKVSDKLLAMISTMHAQGFWIPTRRAMMCHIMRSRAKLARGQNIPRFMQIHLHSFRHFRATMTYHPTKDILFVKQLLGHRSLNNTLIYTQLVNWPDENNFHCAIAKSLEEASKLIESGFD